VAEITTTQAENWVPQAEPRLSARSSADADGSRHAMTFGSVAQSSRPGCRRPCRSRRCASPPDYAGSAVAVPVPIEAARDLDTDHRRHTASSGTGGALLTPAIADAHVRPGAVALTRGTRGYAPRAGSGYRQAAWALSSAAPQPCPRAGSLGSGPVLPKPHLPPGALPEASTCRRAAPPART